MTSRLFQCSFEKVSREFSYGNIIDYRNVEKIRDSLRVKVILKNADRTEAERRIRKVSGRLSHLKESMKKTSRSPFHDFDDEIDERCETPESPEF